MRLLRIALLVTILTTLGLPAGCYVWKWADNSRFAHNFFNGKVEIVRVIASKRWHNFGDNIFACTYAVVEFSEKTASRLRADGPKALLGAGWKHGGQERWDVDWEKTPVGEWVENRPADPLIYCLTYISESDATMIRNGLEKEGSWYYRKGQIATFLSPESRIAASLRYGD